MSRVGFVLLFISFFATSFANAEYLAEVKAWKAPGIIPRPRLSHHYVRVYGDGVVYDISFLPTDSHTRRNGRMPFLGSHPGQNLTQEETDKRGMAAGRIISSSGLFPISPETFYRVKDQSERLSSGGVPYRFIGQNCVTAMTEANGPFRTGLKFGPRLVPNLVNSYTQGYVESQVRRPALFGRR